MMSTSIHCNFLWFYSFHSLPFSLSTQKCKSSGKLPRSGKQDFIPKCIPSLKISPHLTSLKDILCLLTILSKDITCGHDLCLCQYPSIIYFLFVHFVNSLSLCLSVTLFLAFSHSFFLFSLNIRVMLLLSQHTFCHCNKTPMFRWMLL